MIVWAETPYITEHMPEANENAVSQMTELIWQNCNHPSIVCWGLSNEITATGGVSEDLVATHKRLNDLCHKLDPSRFTTMANASMPLARPEKRRQTPLMEIDGVLSYLIKDP